MKCLTLIIILFVSIASAVAIADDEWVYVGESSNGVVTHKYYIDETRIRFDGKFVYFHFLTQYDSPVIYCTEVKGQHCRSFVNLYQGNCGTYEIKMLRHSMYEGELGTKLAYRKDIDVDFKDNFAIATRNSFQELGLDYVCSKMIKTE